MQGRSVFSIPQILVFLAAFALQHQSRLKLRKRELPASTSPEPGACQAVWWCCLKSCQEGAPTGSPTLKAPCWWHLDHRFVPPIYPTSAGAPDCSPPTDGHWAPTGMRPCWLHGRRTGGWAGELEVGQESQAAASSLLVPGKEFECELESHVPGRCWMLPSQTTGDFAVGLRLPCRNDMMDKEAHPAAFGRKRSGRASVERPILIRYIHFIFS